MLAGSVSTADQVAAYGPSARTISGLPATIIYLPDNPDVVTGVRAYMQNGIGYIEGAPNYTITERIALHELGHLWHYNDRSREEAWWQSRFGGCVSAPGSWAEALADTNSWQSDPRESIAECFAIAVIGLGKERTLDYGCDIDSASQRDFFNGTPIIEWVGPAAPGNSMSGRSGNPVSLFVDHWTVGSLTSAIREFKTAGTEKSAHYIVGLDGRIVQLVPDEDTAYHAGNFDVNLISIGIEHEAGPTTPPTDALYAASAWLHAQLSAKYHIALEPLVTVKRHNQIVLTACPGTLDVDRIVKEATGDMTQDEFNAMAVIWWRDVAQGPQTLDAMKRVYDPIVPLAHPKSHHHDGTVLASPFTTSDPKP